MGRVKELGSLQAAVAGRARRLKACAQFSEQLQGAGEVHAWLDAVQDTVSALTHEQQHACKDEADDEAVLRKCQGVVSRIEAQTAVVPWLHDVSKCPDLDAARSAVARLLRQARPLL